jgi:Coenzyme PQQ synthesis protein D (PqqD)
MIYTAFSTSGNENTQWQAELLEYSWGRARQPGELVHLVDESSGHRPLRHRLARVVETQRWSPHPYTGDLYPPYQKAAALLEWLFVEQVEGTVLLLESTSVFRTPISDEVKPGQARATAWPELPRAAGPFGLGPDFKFLEGFCVDRALELPAVVLPVLIHSTDLRKIVARWLELMSIIRAETAGSARGPLAEADKIAYVIAAAEARIPHTVAVLGASTESDAPEAPLAPILDYRCPIPSLDGSVGWDAGTYRDWGPVQPDSAKPGLGREFLGMLAELRERRAQGLELAFQRPYRQKGVREGKILDSTFLDIPGRADTVTLNSSGAAIWEVCDGTRSLAEINQELEARFDMPAGSLRADIEVVIKRLEAIGALRIAPV